MPYAFVAWHPLFANIANKHIEWPKADYEAYLKKAAHEEVAEAFSKTLPTRIKNSFDNASIITELIPLLTRIVSPDIKLVCRDFVGVKSDADTV